MAVVLVSNPNLCFSYGGEYGPRPWLWLRLWQGQGRGLEPELSLNLERFFIVYVDHERITKNI
jgi:hypothetical protein